MLLLQLLILLMLFEVVEIVVIVVSLPLLYYILLLLISLALVAPYNLIAASLSFSLSFLFISFCKFIYAIGFFAIFFSPII